MRRMRDFIITFAMMLSLMPVVLMAQTDSVTLSEIMFDAVGADDYDEFIEIYNYSKTQTYDLSGWKLSDSSGTDNIIDAGEGLLLYPGQYGIILDGDYNSGTKPYNTLIPDTARILKIGTSDFCNGGLRSSPPEPIYLIKGTDTVSRYKYSGLTPSGISDEKIIMDNNNNPSNWGRSLTIYGTPGFKNSVSPVVYDLSVSGNRLSFSPASLIEGDTVRITAKVRNSGMQTMTRFKLKYYDDANQNYLPDNAELLDSTLYSGALASGDSVLQSVTTSPLSAGWHRFIAVIADTSVLPSPDENSGNNRRLDSVRVTPAILADSVTISEVMFKPLSGTTIDEFVELYNYGSSPVNFTGWKIRDNSSTDDLVDAGFGMTLAPGKFAVIFPQTYDPASGVYADLIPPDALIIKVDDSSIGNQLTNEGDMIKIINPGGDTVSVYVFTAPSAHPAGYSYEKRLLTPDNSASNWAVTLNLNGTPGSLNSITPVDYDLSVPSQYVSLTPPYPEQNAPFIMKAIIKNSGGQPSGSFSVIIQRIIQSDTIVKLNQNYSGLNAGDSMTVMITDTALISGDQKYRIRVIYGQDQKPDNNTALKTLLIGKPRNCVVINEFIYKPLSDLSDWVELYNRSNDTLDLNGWKFADGSILTTPVRLTAAPFPLLPGEFVVISGDTDQISGDPIKKIKVADFPNLNSSSSDKAVLFDSVGAVIDSLDYSPSWGGSDGISLERRHPDSNAVLASSWGTCTDPSGSTPGRLNSLFTVAYDLSFGSQGITFAPPFPAPGESFTVQAIIKNLGTMTSGSFAVSLWRLLPGDTVLLLNQNYWPMNAGDSLIISLADTARLSGLQKYRVTIDYPGDMKPSNNTLTKTLFTGTRRYSAVINEIKYYESAGDWIEIYNRSGDTLDLKKWKLADEVDFKSPKTITASTFILLPGDYVVVSSDTAQFAGLPFMKIKMSLSSFNQTGDMAVLFDSLGAVVDSVFYDDSWGGNAAGKSLERIRSGSGSNDPANWGTSVDPSGSTPGVINSLTPMNKDLSVAAAGITAEPAFPLAGDSVRFNIVMRNSGSQTVSDTFYLRTYYDANRNRLPDQEELLDDAVGDYLTPGDSLVRAFTWPVPASAIAYGFLKESAAAQDSLTIIAVIGYPDDERPQNNTAIRSFRLGTRPQTVVVNEILYYPDTNQVEFAELYNRSDEAVNLKNWKIGDATSSKTITASDHWLPPGGYRALTADTSVYRKFSGLPDSLILIIPSMPSLNNDKDAVYIKDPNGVMVDSVYYYNTWGGRPGVSLERIDANRYSNDPGNWSSSASAGGCSPGAINGVLLARPYPRHALIINEIMYSPFTNEPEYIEFYNRTDSTWNISNWSIQVGTTKVIITTNSLLVPPDGYLVVSENKTLSDRFTPPPTLLVKLSNMPSLSNSGAMIVIRDMVGTSIDSVYYDPAWGGGTGIALERIRPDEETTIPSNWGSCVFTEGGTPGYRNSLYHGQDRKKIRLTADPNPFFTDRNEKTRLIIELPVPQARLTLKIYDHQGRLIHTLLNNAPSGSYREVIWDGKDSKGRWARIGIYVIYLEALYETSKYHESVKKTVVLGRKL